MLPYYIIQFQTEVGKSKTLNFARAVPILKDSLAEPANKAHATPIASKEWTNLSTFGSKILLLICIEF